MVRPFWLVATVALLAVPVAEACSLVGHTFGSPTFDEEDGDLWYVDGAGSLRRQRGALDIEVEDAFMLTYATLPGEVLLIAGQDGLGGDCSGTDWLELRRGGEVVWRREGHDEGDDLFDATLATTAMAHPLGPFAQLDGRYWRLDGDELVEVGRPTHGTVLWDFDAEGRPVEASGQDVYVGDRHLQLTGYLTAMAVGDGQTAIVERIDWSLTVVHFVTGDQVRNVTWMPPQGREPTAAWSDVLVVSVGNRAYRVTEEVTDLGLDGVVAVAARGEDTAVFTEDGYVVFDGTQPIERWTRGEGTWTPGAVPTVRSSPVQSSDGPARPLPEGQPPGDGGDGGSAGGPDIPSAGFVGVLAAMALVLMGRRRRARPFDA